MSEDSEAMPEFLQMNAPYQKKHWNCTEDTAYQKLDAGHPDAINQW